MVLLDRMRDLNDGTGSSSNFGTRNEVDIAATVTLVFFAAFDQLDNQIFDADVC